VKAKRKKPHQTTAKLPTKYDSTGRIGADWPKVLDNGYTAICTGCDKRHDFKSELAGKSRFVDIKQCGDDKCRKSESKFARYYKL
jgi:hypothetical protein